MASSAKTPNRIVLEDECYSIPIYQRLFAWTPKEIVTLLNDLYDQFDKGHEHYYVGILTATSNNELVDGQQRFTVMTLLALEMRKYYEEWDKFLKKGDSPRLNFTARPNDRQYLVGKIFRKSNGPNNPFMEAGLECIRTFLDGENMMDSTSCMNPFDYMVSPSLEQKVRRRGFCRYVYEHLAFFIQTLPQGYSGRMLNKYFESMNSTGRNLENHEILKVDLLSKAKVDDDIPEYDRLVSMWNKASCMTQTIYSFYDEEKRKKYEVQINGIKEFTYDNDCKDDEHSMSILNVIDENSQVQAPQRKESTNPMRSFLSFTDFLLQVLYIFLVEKNRTEEISSLQRFFKPENLCATFKEFLPESESKHFIEMMYRYRVILDWAVLRIDGQGDYDLAMTQEDNSALQQYEAMLFASSSRDTYYQWIPVVLKYIYEKGHDEKRLLEKLKSEDMKTHKCPDVNTLFYRRIDHYYFRRLDYYLWEEFHNGTVDWSQIFDRELSNEEKTELCAAISEFKFHQYESVEHLHPQDESKQIIKWVESKDDKEGIKILNHFGNLALISNSFNSSQNNDSLNPKFGRIRDQITQKRLESIKLALMYYCAEAKSENWKKDVSEAHGKKMEDFLLGTYPQNIEG